MIYRFSSIWVMGRAVLNPRQASRIATLLVRAIMCTLHFLNKNRASRLAT